MDDKNFQGLLECIRIGNRPRSSAGLNEISPFRFGNLDKIRFLFGDDKKKPKQDATKVSNKEKIGS